MDPVRVGRALRALRIRRRWRQLDLAGEVGISRQLVAKIESGRLDDVQVRSLRRIAEGLGASFELLVRWRGEALDRLLDAAHASLVEGTVARLEALGWESVVEASFAVRGERGSIDVFALHRPTSSVLVVEAKSVVPDSQATIHGIDRKARLARELALERGWPCTSVSRLLVIGESTTARRRLAALDRTYRAAFPTRGQDVVGWLRAPVGRMSGLLLVPFATGDGTRHQVTGRERVRRRRS